MQMLKHLYIYYILGKQKTQTTKPAFGRQKFGVHSQEQCNFPRGVRNHLCLLALNH